MLRSLMMAGLAFVSACELVDVQAEVQQTCMTYPGVHIEAAPPGVKQLSTTITIDQLDAFHSLAEQGFTLDLASGDVHAASGISSFAFVDRAHVTIASGDPSTTLPSIDAFDCKTCDGSGATLALPRTATADLVPYIKTGSLVVSLDFSGDAPPTAWSIDVSVCTTGTASYSFAP